MGKTVSVIYYVGVFGLYNWDTLFSLYSTLWAALHLWILWWAWDLHVHQWLSWISVWPRFDTDVNFKKPNIQQIHRVIMVVAYCKLPCVYGNCSAPEKCTCNNGYFGTTCAKGFCLCFLFLISLLTWAISFPNV